MSKSIREQLADAWRASDHTLADLIKRSGLRLTVPGLSRRFSGQNTLSADEAEALASALGLKVSVRRPRSEGGDDVDP